VNHAKHRADMGRLSPVACYFPSFVDVPGIRTVSYPGSKKHRTEASIRVPRMFNHTHSNNMINR
jgi:hypothetical protein